MPDLTVIDCEPVSPDVVATLGSLLERAHAGELSSIAVAYVLRDGNIGREWSTPPSFGTLLGSVARLLHRMNIAKDEE